MLDCSISIVPLCFYLEIRMVIHLSSAQMLLKNGKNSTSGLLNVFVPSLLLFFNCSLCQKEIKQTLNFLGVDLKSLVIDRK